MQQRLCLQIACFAACLLLPASALMAAELCDHDAPAEVEGIISSVEDASDGEGEDWIIYSDDEKSNCLYMILGYSGKLPEACKEGAKFSGKGRIYAEGIAIQDPMLDIETIECHP